MNLYAFVLVAVIVFLWGGLVMRYGQPQRVEGHFIYVGSESFTSTAYGAVFEYERGEAPQEGPTR